MSQELSPAQRQELFDLLLGELRGARDTARRDGATEAAVVESAERRRLRLRGSTGDDGCLADGSAAPGGDLTDDR